MLHKHIIPMQLTKSNKTEYMKFHNGTKAYRQVKKAHRWAPTIQYQSKSLNCQGLLRIIHQLSQIRQIRSNNSLMNDKAIVSEDINFSHDIC